MNYYPFHVGDFMTRTVQLTPMQELAYRRLLDLYYLNEKPLEGNAEELAWEVRLNECSTDVERVLNKYFILLNGRWHNKRADEEIAAYKATKERNSKAGKASGKARSEKAKAAQTGSKRTSVERKANNRSTLVQQPFNERSTTVEPTRNQEPVITVTTLPCGQPAAEGASEPEAGKPEARKGERLTDDQKPAKPGSGKWEQVRLALDAWHSEHDYPPPTVAEVKRGLGSCGLLALVIEFGQVKALDLRRLADSKWPSSSWNSVWSRRHELSRELDGKAPARAAQPQQPSRVQSALDLVRAKAGEAS